MEKESVAPILAAVLTVVAALAMTSPFAAFPSEGRSTYNLNPAFSELNNDLVWDPNFLPGFAGTPSVHINWSAPQGGPGTIDYYVGPWANASVAPYPHFSVGPQAFNFVEIPRTQVYRSPAWGDYDRVQQGFVPCAVNQGNLTVNASQAAHPVYVGMPEQGVDWKVEFTLGWTDPEPTAGLPISGRVALTTTTTLPPLPGQSGARLVYSQLVLWSDTPVAQSISEAPGGTTEGAIGIGVFPVAQLTSSTIERTFSIDLSPFLGATLTGLGLASPGALLSYVYLEVGGYNLHFRLHVDNLFLTGPTSLCGSSLVASLDPNAASPRSLAAGSAAVVSSPAGRDYFSPARRRPMTATAVPATTAPIAAERTQSGTTPIDPSDEEDGDAAWVGSVVTVAFSEPLAKPAVVRP